MESDVIAPAAASPADLRAFSGKFSVLSCGGAGGGESSGPPPNVEVFGSDPPPRHQHEFEIIYAFQHDHSILIWAESLWHIVCNGEKKKFNRQLKRMFTSVFGSEADAEAEIKTWPYPEWVPLHIALACLSSRAVTARHSHDLVLDDFLLQLTNLTAHLHLMREQVLLAHASEDALAHSACRSDALAAPPAAVASETDDDDDDDDFDQDGDQDVDQNGDGDQDVDDDGDQDVDHGCDQDDDQLDDDDSEVYDDGAEVYDDGADGAEYALGNNSNDQATSADVDDSYNQRAYDGADGDADCSDEQHAEDDDDAGSDGSYEEHAEAEADVEVEADFEDDAGAEDDAGVEAEADFEDDAGVEAEDDFEADADVEADADKADADAGANSVDSGGNGGDDDDDDDSDDGMLPYFSAADAQAAFHFTDAQIEAEANIFDQDVLIVEKVFHNMAESIPDKVAGVDLRNMIFLHLLFI